MDRDLQTQKFLEVRLHGGDIGLESRVGEGALFRLRLPLQPAPVQD